MNKDIPINSIMLGFVLGFLAGWCSAVLMGVRFSG